jgi:predicted cupin superfamily sugar epimerase
MSNEHQTNPDPLSALDLIEQLDLAPHFEGGWFRETWRAAAEPGARPAGTAIYYLMTRENPSRLHRIDAAEIWHHYCGAPVEIRLGVESEGEEVFVLGSDLGSLQVPQVIVPEGTWQSARPLGAFALVGCTVSPAFDPAFFERADERTIS